MDKYSDRSVSGLLKCFGASFLKVIFFLSGFIVRAGKVGYDPPPKIRN